MKIAGIQKLSLVDYPGKTCCTVFTAGCDLRCPFCHNASLVTHIEGSSLPEDEVMDFLKKRAGLLQAVTISGGEPLMQSGVKQFAQNVKELGYLVKLDTNGTFPDKLKALVKSGAIDFVAMDIKNSKRKYAITSGVKDLDLKKVEESVEFLKSASVSYEFRTTVVREFHSAEDFAEIAAWLGPVPAYCLQQFVNSGDLINDGVHGYDDAEMKALLKEVKKYIPNACLRGVT